MNTVITSRGGARDADARLIRDQIGLGNVLAISGGRWFVQEHGIRLPVSNGYSVVVTYEDNDTYTVERVFKRGDRVSIKGSRTDVYAEELGETAYRASCFRSSGESEW